MTVVTVENYERCNLLGRRNSRSGHQSKEETGLGRRYSCSLATSQRLVSAEPLETREPIHLPLPSTEELHASGDRRFFGRYAHVRAKIDYSHHSNYVKDRQQMQDKIIEKAIYSARAYEHVEGIHVRAKQQWVAFTAGAMGVGKSHAIRMLGERGRFPLDQFIRVDPDEIRSLLPEFSVYCDIVPDKAGELTNKECGYVAELMTQVALEQGRSVLVEGTLRNANWHKAYFDQIRSKLPSVGIAILHITAPKEIALKRAQERSKHTGRVVPPQALEMAFQMVPKSVEVLAPLADYVCELSNNPEATDLEIVTVGQTWNNFRSRWDLKLFKGVDGVSSQSLNR